MELILKRPINKPPCICIKFGSSYEGSKLHCALPNEYSSHPLSVKFELSRHGKLDIVIIAENYKIPYKYENVKFSPEKLNRFLVETEGTEAFNFCHIVTVKNKDEVLYTPYTRRLWVLKLKAAELIKEY
jgi:hypothetical protein